MQDRTHVPLLALDVIYMSMEWWKEKKRKGEQKVLREEGHRKTCETCQARGWFSTDPSSTEHDDCRATSEKCQMPVPSNDDRSIGPPNAYMAPAYEPEEN